MPAPADEKLYTPEDLLCMEDGDYYELLDGRLVERSMSTDSTEVGAQFIHLLLAFVRAQRLGKVFSSELLIRIFPNPQRVRKADASFIAAERAPREDQGFLTVPPDLVVEVVSPNDRAAEVRAKVTEWLDAGVRLVWVAYPGVCEIGVYRRGGHPSILAAGDELSGEDVVPGFSCRVADCFPPD